MTVAYVVTFSRHAPYGACEKLLVNGTAPVRRPYDDDTISVRVLRAPYGRRMVSLWQVYYILCAFPKI